MFFYPRLTLNGPLIVFPSININMCRLAYLVRSAIQLASTIYLYAIGRGGGGGVGGLVDVDSALRPLFLLRTRGFVTR